MENITFWKIYNNYTNLKDFLYFLTKLESYTLEES